MEITAEIKVKLREIINEISMENQHMSLRRRQWYEERILKLFNSNK